MSDIALDATGDIIIGEDGDLQLVTGADAVIQHLEQRLKTFFGEWFLETRTGIPFFEHVLRKDFNPTVIDSIFKTTILDTPGVDELLEFDVDLNTSTREMTLTFKARILDEEIDFSIPLGVI